MAQKRCPELTVMSGIAIIFVLLIHACGSCLGYLYPGMGYEDADVFLRTLNNLVTPAVPMFLFASGFKYALHDTDTPYWTFLKKRLPRVLMSFFIINTFFWIIDSIIWMDHFDPILLCKTYISSWLGNTVAYPLWYIPMYCCVIISCPLVCRVVKKSWIRFLLYLAVGCAQRLLAVKIPLLGRYPFLFVSYPTFFELGIMAHDYDFPSKLKRNLYFPLLFGGIVICLSVFAPSLSRAAYVQYIFICVFGVLAYYSISLFLCGNKPLSWLGAYSYPIFLLHEPVIGRLSGSILRYLNIPGTVLYSASWFFLTLFSTLFTIFIFKLVHVNHWLWNFSLSVSPKTSRETTNEVKYYDSNCGEF